MQSGISASKDLHAAFQTLLSNPSQRGLLVDISAPPETLVPNGTIPSASLDFSTDLASIGSLLSDDQAAYLVLRRYGGDVGASGAFVAVTFVPEKAPVRQKMLFASTRLAMVRELGNEHFASTLFATTKEELTATGWAKHEAQGSLSAPLTDEEKNLQGIKEAEAQESTGTGARRSHVSSGIKLPFTTDALAALKGLRAGEEALVQLHVDTNTETITLGPANTSSVVTPSSLGSLISSEKPQYSFYRHVGSGSSNTSVLFIYSCPSVSKIKERMLYASSLLSVIALARDEAGIEVSKRIEVSEPTDLTEQSIMDDLGLDQTKSSTGGFKERAFDKPKRPGKR